MKQSKECAFPFKKLFPLTIWHNLVCITNIVGSFDWQRHPQHDDPLQAIVMRNASSPHASSIRTFVSFTTSKLVSKALSVCTTFYASGEKGWRVRWPVAPQASRTPVTFFGTCVSFIRRPPSPRAENTEKNPLAKIRNPSKQTWVQHFRRFIVGLSISFVSIEGARL